MSIIVNFAGDMSFSHFEKDDISFCDKTKQILAAGDINICNLEHPICDSGLIHKAKPIVLRSDKLPLAVLEMFHVFSLANNHIFDYQVEGYQQTLKYLDNNKKRYFGAGLNLQEATKPLLIHTKLVNLAIWGITRFENASKHNPGTAKDYLKYYEDDIKQYKSKGYFIIFYAHWGREYVDYPTPDDRYLAKALIDCGADFVIGTHPHVPQGFEIYKGKYIIYSMGNFVFSNAIGQQVAFDQQDNRLTQGYIVQIKVNNDLTYTPCIIPYKTVNGIVSILGQQELDLFKQKMVRISLETSDDSVFLKKFFNSASEIRKQSQSMIKKQVSEHGLSSLTDAIKSVRLQDIRIALYPSLEHKFPILSKENILSRLYSAFIHKFLTFSVIGIIVTLTTMATMGFLLGIAMLPLFPTWWIVYLSSISLSLFLNNKLVFKVKITLIKVVLFSAVYISSMFLGIFIIKYFRSVTSLPNWLLGYLALPFTLTYNFLFINQVLKSKVVKNTIDKGILEQKYASIFDYSIYD